MGFGLGLRKRPHRTAAPSIFRSLKKGPSSGKFRRINEKGLKRSNNETSRSSGRMMTAEVAFKAKSGKFSSAASGIKSTSVQGAAKKKIQPSRASNGENVASHDYTSEKHHFTEDSSTSSDAMAVGKVSDNGDDYPSRKMLKQKHDPKLSLLKHLANQQELQKKSVKTAKQSKLSNKELVADDQSKKKKRIIRIDPFDISNKRIDDSIQSPPTKDEDMGKCVDKLSKNMQLRSIRPSVSALSFVEDNLLGRRRMMELKNAGYNVDLPVPLDNIPFSTSEGRSRIEENVFRNKMEFFAAAKVSSSFPPPVLPEVAFAGISNVGKSSLLNALTRQWGVARTSDRPGHTQTINFFRLASKLCLVDLPGYGFAYAKSEVKEAWEDLVMEYVSTREGLQRVCLLIDTKRGMKSFDHELIDLMERSRTPFQVVLTKTDVVFPIDVARRATQIQQDLEMRKSMVRPVMMVSSKSGGGIRSLRTVLSRIARFVKV